MNTHFIRFLLFTTFCIYAGCANITTPTGGKKDTTPPKLISIDPPDSMLNTKPKRIEMHFDEYITVSDVSKEVHISPILPIDPTVVGTNKRVVVKIADTLLEDSTTYRLSLGNSIKDLHEGNPFPHYVYTFSTGGYFDSLRLSGTVIDAATGLPDTGTVYVTLYSASKSDSMVVRKRPQYITKADGDGFFLFKGLPARKFRIYGLKDVNGNLIYDGEGEKIGFLDRIVMPGDTTQPPILLKIFAEAPDTSIKKNTDTTKNAGANNSAKSKGSGKEGLSYGVTADTSNPERRTFDITRRFDIVFSKRPVVNYAKITLSYDSAGVAVTPLFSVVPDSLKPDTLHVNTEWKENTRYTLKLAKGFAKDTSGADAMPGRFTFRTKEEEDYGKIQVHLPAKYYDSLYLLMVVADRDTIYTKPVADTIVNLSYLPPGSYTFRIIVDKNRNGKWDAGSLFKKIQPEEVIPYTGGPLTLKAGWENIVDFEEKPKLKEKVKGNSKEKNPNSK